MSSRKAPVVFESLEQRSLLSATLLGPDGTLSPDLNWLEFTAQNGQPTLENVATKATTPIPVIGTFSGDSKNIVYAVNQGTSVPKIFIYNIASGTNTQVPFNDFASFSGTKGISEIVASPNGRYASFVYTPSGQFIDSFHDVYLLDLQNLTTQVIGSSDALHPSFSPDSQNVAYADYTTSSSNPSGVFAYNIPAATTTRLSVDNNGNPIPTLSSDTSFHIGSPEEPIGPIIWSPDSKLVAFPLVQENQSTYSQLNYVRNLTTNTTEDVTDSSFALGTIDRIGGGTPIAFSPDDKYLLGPGFTNIATGATITPQISIQGFGATGQQVIVSRTDGQNNTHLFLVDLRSETGKMITTDEFDGSPVGYSYLMAVTPDRTHAIVVSNGDNLAPGDPNNGSANLYLFPLTPDANAPAYTEEDFISSPTTTLIPSNGILSPDGQHVAFVTKTVNSKASYLLHIADTAANTDTVVPGDGVLDQGTPFTASFTADGKSLLFSSRVPTDQESYTFRVFRYDLTTGKTTSVPFEPQNNGNISNIIFNSTGTYAIVTIPDGNGGNNVIVTNLTTGEFTPNSADAPSGPVGFNTAGNTVYLYPYSSTPGLYTMDVNTGLTTLVSKDSNGNPLPDGSGTASGSADYRIVGSQDSKYVAFTLDLPSATGIPVQHTYVLNVQTGTVTNYDDPSAGPNGTSARTAPIAFSPDDTYLLEGANTQGTGNEDHLSLMNLSTGQRTAIPFNSGVIGFGFGSGGQSVIFDGFLGESGFQIISYDIPTGKETILTSGSNPMVSGISADGLTLLIPTEFNPGGTSKPVPGDADAYVLSLPPPTSTTPTAPTSVVEDDSAAYTGAWWQSSSGSGISGSSFHNDGNLAKGSSTATFPLHVTTPGSYAVFARWPSITFGSAATSVPFDVVTSTGTVTINEDETQHTGQWVLLGTFDLNSDASVAVRNAGTTGIVLADAVGTAPSSGTTNNPPPPPPPNPIIVDDDDSRVAYTGNWYSSSGSAGNGYFANDFRNDGNQLKGSSSVTFPAPIPSSGSYQVFIRYPSISFGTAASNVPVDIITNTGTQTIIVDETQNAGQFFSLGTFTLDPSTAKVVIRNAGTNGIVLADAVEYVGVGSTNTGGGGGTTTTTTPPATIVDDDDTSRVTYTGNWYSSSGNAGSDYFAGDFRNDGNQLKGSSSVKFSIPITAAGSYQVYARWPSISFGSAATNVPFDIVTSTGTTTVFEDETKNTGLWVLLGTYNLDPSTAAVIVRNAGTSGVVLADAIGVTPAQ